MGATLAAALVMGAMLVSHPGWAQQSANPSRVVVAVVGDVLLEAPWIKPRNPSQIFNGVREEFARADLVFANFEEPITSRELVTPDKDPEKVRAGADYILRARNGAIPVALKYAGIGLVGLANNHTMDYTPAGMRDTLQCFREADLPAVGAGLKADAERAFIFSSKGLRIALLAFSDVVPIHSAAGETREGVASAKNERDLANAIARARQESDFTVLVIHWGGQGHHLITKRQHYLARLAAKAGCDAVVGMHPHVLQGIEFVGKTPVFYSIGNFAFPTISTDAHESLVLRLGFESKQLEAIEIVPAEISWNGVPRIAKGRDGDSILRHLDGYCRTFNSRISHGTALRAAQRQPLVFDASSDAPQ